MKIHYQASNTERCGAWSVVRSVVGGLAVRRRASINSLSRRSLWLVVTASEVGLTINDHLSTANSPLTRSLLQVAYRAHPHFRLHRVRERGRYRASILFRP